MFDGIMTHDRRITTIAATFPPIEEPKNANKQTDTEYGNISIPTNYGRYLTIFLFQSIFGAVFADNKIY